MATGTSRVEFDVPARVGGHQGNPAATPRPRRGRGRIARWVLAGLLVLGVVVGMFLAAVVASPTRAEAQGSEMLDFDTAYMACRELFLDGRIAEVWFADSDYVLTEERGYREQLDDGEITEDDYLAAMAQFYELWFDKWDFYYETVLPSNSPTANCQALVDRDQSPPTTTTTTPTTMGPMPTTTTTAPDPDPESEDDPVEEDGTAEEEEEETGPYSEANYVLGDDESCAGEDEVASTGRGGGKFQSYEAYGDEWLASGFGNDAQELAAADDLCIPRGYVLITCRDENDNAFDDWGVVQVHADLPTWWFREVYIESTTNEGDGCSLAENRPRESCDELVDIRTVNVTASHSYSFRDFEDYDPIDAPGMLPDRCWGTFPTALYEISANDDNNFDILGGLTALMFGIAKGAIQLVLWVVEFGFTFNVTQYSAAVADIADKYQVHLIEPLNMLDIVWFWLVAWVAITALRGKFAMAGGELLMTLVLLTMATVLYEGNTAYMRSTSIFMDLSSSAMLTASQGKDPSTNDNVLSTLLPLEEQIHEQFVELPYQHLNWGSFIPEESCRAAADHIMATGHDSDGWPGRHMRRAGDECEAYADYNKDANATRTFGALLTLVVAVIVALTLGLTAFTVLVCKFLIAVLFAMTPFVLLSAVLPATGRRMFWSWCGSVFQLVLAVIGSGGLLALVMLGVDMVVAVTEGRELIERWFLVLMVVAVLFHARRKMIGQAQQWATSLSDNLTRLSPGSAHWSGGGQVGFDLDRVDRGAMQSLRTAGYGAAVGAYVGGRIAAAPIRGVGIFAANWSRDKRNKRFGARNLAHNREALQEWEQRPTVTFRRDTDGKMKRTVEARLRIPSDRREMRGFRERVGFINSGGRPAESEAVLPGSDINRTVSTYQSRRNVGYEKSPILDPEVLDGRGFRPRAPGEPRVNPPRPTTPKSGWGRLGRRLQRRGLGALNRMPRPRMRIPRRRWRP